MKCKQTADEMAVCKIDASEATMKMETVSSGRKLWLIIFGSLTGGLQPQSHRVASSWLRKVVFEYLKRNQMRICIAMIELMHV